MARLPVNHPTRQKVVKFILDRSCGVKVGTLDKVYCCDGSKGTFPIDCKLAGIRNANVKKAGTKPSPSSNAGGNVPVGDRKVR